VVDAGLIDQVEHHRFQIGGGYRSGIGGERRPHRPDGERQRGQRHNRADDARRGGGQSGGNGARHGSCGVS
jgi:hypothetical protein